MSGGGRKDEEESRRGRTPPVTGAFFLENPDGAITSPAAPHMAASFKGRPADLGTAMTGRGGGAAVTTAAAGCRSRGHQCGAWTPRRSW